MQFLIGLIFGMIVFFLRDQWKRYRAKRAANLEQFHSPTLLQGEE
jgi:hypothetical protein